MMVVDHGRRFSPAEGGHGRKFFLTALTA